MFGKGVRAEDKDLSLVESVPCLDSVKNRNWIFVIIKPHKEKTLIELFIPRPIPEPS